MAKHCLNCEKRIGVLGGTFDPVHNGHVALGKAALQQGNLSRLIIMPAEVQPFKRDRETADDVHRLNMVRLAFEDIAAAEVSDYEMKNTDISYTYDTLMHLQKLYPDDEIAFIMGTDAFLEVDTWYKGVELLETFSFLVSARPGYRESELEKKIESFRQRYGTSVEKLLMEMPDVSSTDIRSFCSRGLPLTGKVPEKVERYISEHGLYKKLY
ncbi:MAG: nicotinate (nicotinamide) nucleotide adenylyltransferase [Emergencia sp.]